MNEDTLDEALIKNHKPAWNGGDLPFKTSYGKMMMWFFLITDTLTFSAFLIHYGYSRFNFSDIWPVPEEVFTHFPFMKGEHPLLFVALMTFILIMSSVTMVLAVNYGHKMQKKKVILWLSLTIIGGAAFLGSQAWEWGHFIHGDKGAIDTHTEYVAHIAKGDKLSSIYELLEEDKYSNDNLKFKEVWYDETCACYGTKGVNINKDSISEKCFNDRMVDRVIEKIKEKKEFNIRISDKKYLTNKESIEYLQNNATKIILGANLVNNEYGHPLFADYFYFITGFHGFHVFTGVVLLIILLINVIKGTYERRGHYEMVEKIGLYWHFVDLVWVFVFTFFYLV